MARTVSLAMKQAQLNIELERLTAYTNQVATIKAKLAEVETRFNAKVELVKVLKDEVIRLTPQ